MEWRDTVTVGFFLRTIAGYAWISSVRTAQQYRPTPFSATTKETVPVQYDFPVG
jgi:hypothetical protein